MLDYLKLARDGDIAYTTALAQAHNALMVLIKTPHPTNQDFKTFDILEKQIKALHTEITIECMHNEGYEINTHTQMWEKQ